MRYVSEKYFLSMTHTKNTVREANNIFEDPLERWLKLIEAVSRSIKDEDTEKLRLELYGFDA